MAITSHRTTLVTDISSAPSLLTASDIQVYVRDAPSIEVSAPNGDHIVKTYDKHDRHVVGTYLDMNITISIRRAENEHSARWLLLATLDGVRSSSFRHHFAIATNTQHQALSILGDLLDEISRRTKKASFGRNSILEATCTDQKDAVRGPHEFEEWTASDEPEAGQ